MIKAKAPSGGRPSIENSAEPSTLGLPPLLRTFAFGTVLLGLACVATMLFCRLVLHLTRDPYGSIAFEPRYDYVDARMFAMRIAHFHQPSFFSPSWGPAFLYPAPDAFFYRFYALFPRMPTAFVCGLALILAGLAIGLFLKLKAQGIATTAAALFTAAAVLFSYPLYFEFNRANIEIYVWGLSALGIWAFFRDRPWLAAALIGLAGACKGYPFIYLGLLFARRQYRQTLFAVLVGTAANLASMWAIADNFSIGRRGVAAGLEHFRTLYVLQITPLQVGVDHSIFAILKRVFVEVAPPGQLPHLLNVYLVIAAIVASALYFFRAYRMPAINQVLFLSIACITLPPTSFDYTLLHLYTGWLLLVLLTIDLWHKRREPPPGLRAAFFCFILLLSPQNEFILHGERLEGPIKCLTLLTLAFIVLRYPWQSTPWDEYRQGGWSLNHRAPSLCRPPPTRLACADSSR